MLWGVHNLEDAANDLVTEVGENLVVDNIEARVRIHEEELAGLLDLFAFRTTEYSFGFKSDEGGELQGLDEFGRARPSRGRRGKQVGAPIFRAGDAIAFSYEARIQMTVGLVEDRMVSLMGRDARTVRRWNLSRLLDPQVYAFDDPAGHGELTIYGLANGTDGLPAGSRFTYTTHDGGEAEDTHYLAQLNPISATDNPFPVIKREIEEHPVNDGGQTVAFINPDQRAAVSALPDFTEREDPDVTPVSGERALVGALGARVPGEIIGKTDGVWISEWHAVPSGYVLAVSTGANRTLALREHEVAALRGFGQNAEREDFPYLERQFIRRAGFGAVNRVGAVAYRVGNAAYAAPANLAANRV
jgi:hypothetical protein